MKQIVNFSMMICLFATINLQASNNWFSDVFGNASQQPSAAEIPALANPVCTSEVLAIPFDIIEEYEARIARVSQARDRVASENIIISEERRLAQRECELLEGKVTRVCQARDAAQLQCKGLEHRVCLVEVKNMTLQEEGRALKNQLDHARAELKNKEKIVQDLIKNKSQLQQKLEAQQVVNLNNQKKNSLQTQIKSMDNSRSFCILIGCGIGVASGVLASYLVAKNQCENSL